MTTASQRGVSLIEILVVVAIFAIIAAFGMMLSFDSYRSSNFRNDRNLLIAALQRARAQSMNNICLGTCAGNEGMKHGVKIITPAPPATPTYVIFQTTDSYTSGRDAAQDVVFQAAPATTRTDSDEVVFEQLTGAIPTQVTMTLTGSGRTSVITINTQGAISWTN